MGRIITIKNNKGGVGKSFITSQLAAGLAYADKNVLILTSDSQNNIFNFLYTGDKNFKKGLKSEVSKGDGEYFRLRDNLYFLPLEDSIFSTQFLKKLPEYLEKVKEQYDYILIDGTPVLKLDSVFIDKSDSIIIPSFADQITTESILELLKTIDVTKVKAIITNKYKSTAIQKENFEILKNTLDGTGILFTDPIENLAFIEMMIQSRKTVWEYKNKTVTKVQQILLEILQSI